MTWISHIAVGTATAKFFGFNYYLAAFGSILPDLAERLLPGKVAHRGLTTPGALVDHAFSDLEPAQMRP
jgi:hypothetical protein